MSRKNISLSDSVERKADDLIKNEVGDGLSDLIARLIREEWDRRHGTSMTVEPMMDASSPAAAANQTAKKVAYKVMQGKKSAV